MYRLYYFLSACVFLELFILYLNKNCQLTPTIALKMQKIDDKYKTFDSNIYYK